MSSVSVGTTPTRIVNRNSKRISISFRNSSLSGQSLYLDNTEPGGLTADNAGYVLAAGQSLNFVLLFDGREIRQPFSVISSAAGGVLHYKELADIGEGV